MSARLHQLIRRLLALGRGKPRPVALEWRRRGPDSWLAQALPAGESFCPPAAPRDAEIQATITRLGAMGKQPLWDGYREVYDRQRDVPWADREFARSAGEVSTRPGIGNLFAWLVMRRRPALVIEFGTAFGVSAMYWASGLDAVGAGRLLSFEPNDVWRGIAEAHLSRFSGRITTVAGTFEDRIDAARNGEPIDLAFVDAIHTSEFVDRQVKMLLERLRPGGLILVDDIGFSDDMRGCWERWAQDQRVAASVAADGRVGLLEFTAR